jgi:hypothetical protein
LPKSEHYDAQAHQLTVTREERIIVRFDFCVPNVVHHDAHAHQLINSHTRSLHVPFHHVQIPADRYYCYFVVQKPVEVGWSGTTFASYM